MKQEVMRGIHARRSPLVCVRARGSSSLLLRIKFFLSFSAALCRVDSESYVPPTVFDHSDEASHGGTVDAFVAVLINLHGIRRLRDRPLVLVRNHRAIRCRDVPEQLECSAQQVDLFRRRTVMPSC